MSVAQAEDILLPTEMHSSKVQPTSAEVSQSLTVVSYSDSSQQLGDNSLTPVEPAMGLQVDYQPFDSSFNLSAANFQTQPNAHLNKPIVNRTYLGVGWKKLLDDAQNLGVRVDIGATYDDKSSQSGNEAVKVIDASNQPSSPATSWQPVISLGVSYRF
ncbi:hypothetical protein ACH42_03150 [Endozoicomonas sp. (ex Bugula neritina AB1)]|nr:hypothetical protein ACH42_03150 [Endozoicomonas sp. (ex Bugula neritina AB1)]